MADKVVRCPACLFYGTADEHSGMCQKEACPYRHEVDEDSMDDGDTGEDTNVDDSYAR